MTDFNPYMLGGGAAYHVSLFDDRFGKTFEAKRATLEGLATLIRIVTRASKHKLGLLKLARFGDCRSDQDSLRHNDNVLAISGIEVDYDGEVMPFEQAIAIMRNAKLQALMYTSPSHTPAAPRWRILCPTSVELEPEQRAKLVARVNGLFDGSLGKESFVLSQAFYYGAVAKKLGEDNPDHKVEIIEGDYIDRRDDLDQGAIGPPGGRRARASNGADRGAGGDARPHRGAGGDGAQQPQPPDCIIELIEQDAGKGLSNDPDDLPEPVSLEKIEAALSVIDPDIDRQTWFAIGCGLFSEFGAEGFAIWDGWSKDGAKYNAKEMPGQWRSIVQKKGYDFTIATVMHFANLADPHWRTKIEQVKAKPTETVGTDVRGRVHEKAKPTETVGTDVRGRVDQKARIISATPFVFKHPSKIPLRDWLLRPYYIRKFLSATISTGGIGKSSLIIVEALRMVADKALAGDRPGKQLRVWYWNGEDPMDELDRRFAAAIKHYELKEEDIGDRLFIDSGRTMPIVIATEERTGTKIAGPVVEQVVATLIENQIDVLIIDPFVACHSVNENDNSAINQVAKKWGHIADEANCAVMAVHHSRKTGGENVTTEDGRGASAFRDATRAMRTLNTMRENEADDAEIDEGERRQYFRCDLGKPNMVKPASSADWYKIESVDLGNNELGWGGDEIGVVTAFAYPEVEALEITEDKIRQAQALIKAGGPFRKDRQATKEQWVGLPIAEALGLSVLHLSKTEKKGLAKLVTEGLRAGWLKARDGLDADHKARTYVEAGKVPVSKKPDLRLVPNMGPEPPPHDRIPD